MILSSFSKFARFCYFYVSFVVERGTGEAGFVVVDDIVFLLNL